MNYYELPEYASLAPFVVPQENESEQTAPQFESTSPSPLVRLVASIHRRAAGPRGYRYIANIAATELTRALVAVKHASMGGELRLVTPAVDDSGNPVSDVALYVRDDLPDPAGFWSAFHSYGESHAAA